MGQQALAAIPIIKNESINFIPEAHQFQSLYIQRIKQTPFTNSLIYNSQPSIYIQAAETTVESLVKPRLNTSKLFPKQQIIKIIQNILTALYELQQRNYPYYGNLSLSSIFYHKHTKLFKLINPAFFNSSNYLLAKQGLKFSFLAPEELLNLSSQNGQQQRNFKTDIFIFAICMLQICSLRDSRQIYCSQTYNIFDVQIQDRLKDIQQYYSKDISNFLSLCLQYQLQKRIDVQNALKQIKFIKQKQKGISSHTITSQQSVPTNPPVTVLSPRGDPKKGSLSFGPGTLPKKLPQNNFTNI